MTLLIFNAYLIKIWSFAVKKKGKANSWDWSQQKVDSQKKFKQYWLGNFNMPWFIILKYCILNASYALFNGISMSKQYINLKTSNFSLNIIQTVLNSKY